MKMGWHEGQSNPLYKTVLRTAGAWFTNYSTIQWSIIAPSLGFGGAILAIILAKQSRWAFICSAISITGIIATVGISMFPFILPSSSNPSQSLMVWDSSSSQMTLWIMLVATVILLPIVLVYTAWVYHVLRGKVTVDYIVNNKDTVY